MMIFENIDIKDDDIDDDPEFRLPETDYEIDDDLGDELHVSKRELALLLEDNASILNQEDTPNRNEFINPESVSSNTTCSTITKTTTTTAEIQLTSDQRDILQYQLTAYVQLLTQYILLRRETNSLSSDEQSPQQLFTITKLNFEKNGISDIGVQYLADMLRNNRTITSINLSRNKIGDVGAKYLDDALQNNKVMNFF
ncbi:unnamed protein product [Adineta steineri]|uniref:Uncharacterized protein n=1 Tax=Adineta steineri TaxID=433720 RepID=A0A814IEW9_9BILA|nr:unnamed protein product [Adineta steineri]